MSAPLPPAARWARRVAFSLAPLVILAVGAELGLRASGYRGEPDRTVSWCREHTLVRPPFFPTIEVDGAHIARAPAPESQGRPFPVEKDPGVFRAFALGGSAVHGYGFTRAGAWPDKLEERLVQAWPDRDVEVINAGVIAWSSQQVLAMAKDALAAYQPDALLVYSGNNELLEWFDARRYLPEPEFRRWVRGLTWGRELRGLRTYRWLLGAVGAVDLGAWGQTRYTDDEVLPRDRWAPLTADDRTFAETAWRANITRLMEEAEAAGVPVYLSTVAVNLDDAPGDWDDGAGEPPEVGEHLVAADRAMAAGDFTAAGREGAAALRLRDSATVRYRWAQLLRRHGQPEAAADAYRDALVRDENPNRALPGINAAARDLAERAAGFVDADAVLAARVPDGVTDWSVIYDHCHPTPDSHTALADAWAEALAGAVPSPAPAPGPLHVDAWLGEGVTADPGSYSRDPGTDRRAWLAAARAATEARPEDPDAWAQRGRVAWHTLGADCSKGDRACSSEALDAFRRQAALAPERCDAWANLGRIEHALGAWEAARRDLEAAVRCDPGDARSAWTLDRLSRRGR